MGDFTRFGERDSLPAIVKTLQGELGIPAQHREIVEAENDHILKEVAMINQHHFAVKRVRLTGNDAVSWV